MFVKIVRDSQSHCSGIALSQLISSIDGTMNCIIANPQKRKIP